MTLRDPKAAQAHAPTMEVTLAAGTALSHPMLLDSLGVDTRERADIDAGIASALSFCPEWPRTPSRLVQSQEQRCSDQW